MLSGDEAYELVKRGTQKAANLYEEWACGSFLSDAGVESVIQTEIARSLFGSKDCYVTLETSLNHAADWDDSFEKFELPESSDNNFLSESSRFDICVWSKGHKLSGIVEVKRSLESWQLKKDMSRMRHMILATREDKNIGLRYTMVAMYLWASSAIKLNTLVEKSRKLFDGLDDGEVDCYFGCYPLKSLDKSKSEQCVAIAYFS